ncbi:MAG: hypothetical protein J6D21_03275 [Clostridia bacterium]|nr:hypothetical protein [Clostridia bacterium]
MGRLLGVHGDDQELDRSDLNKCPDCDCFFAADNCPLCGKPCPEHMRAGNRPVVKKKKHKRSSGSSRVTFIEWYYSWWFIVLMMLFTPIIGLILLITSPHQGWKKGLFIGLAVLYLIVSTVGFGSLLSDLSSLWEKPVDTSLTREEYIAVCEEVSPKQFYRTPDQYEDAYLCMTLTVVERATYSDEHEGDVYYICQAEDGIAYVVLLRDCLIDGSQNLIPGDVITVYGEGAGETTVYDANYDPWEGPCLNMAYVQINN